MTYNTTYLNNITADGLLTDRVINDDISLPYSYDELKIKPNEIVNTTTFNRVIANINKNFLYLVSYGKIPSNKIPVNYTSFIGESGSGYGFYERNDFASSTPSTGTIKEAVDMSFAKTTQGGSAGIVCNSTNILLLSAATNDAAVSFPTNEISDSSLIDSNGINFENIRAVDTDTEGHAYVLDNNTIYKYNIKGITSDDTALQSITPAGRNLTNTVGGSGAINDNIKFKSALTFSVYGSDLYVLDQSTDYLNAFVKVFDTNFNFKNIVNLSADLRNYPAVDILPVKSGLMILTLSGHILEYDNDIKLLNIHEPNDIVDLQTENYKRLESSIENDNIFYVMTDKSVFKKFKSKPGRTIGRFLTNTTKLPITSQTFSCMSIKPSQDGDDELFLADNNKGIIYRCLENEDYQDVFYDTFQTQIFQLSALKINGDEYVNNLVYNKAISKILYNHFILRENARAKFQGTFEVTGNLLFDGIKYPTTSESSILEYEASNNNYVGINEIHLSETLNRPVKEIYDLQTLLLGFIKERRTNTYPTSSVVVTV